MKQPPYSADFQGIQGKPRSDQSKPDQVAGHGRRKRKLPCPNRSSLCPMSSWRSIRTSRGRWRQPHRAAGPAPRHHRAPMGPARPRCSTPSPARCRRTTGKNRVDDGHDITRLPPASARPARGVAHLPDHQPVSAALRARQHGAGAARTIAAQIFAVLARPISIRFEAPRITAALEAVRIAGRGRRHGERPVLWRAASARNRAVACYLATFAAAGRTGRRAFAVGSARWWPRSSARWGAISRSS